MVSFFHFHVISPLQPWCIHQAIKNRVKRKGSGDDNRRDSRASTDQEEEDEEEEEEEEEDSNGVRVLALNCSIISCHLSVRMCYPIDYLSISCAMKCNVGLNASPTCFSPHSFILTRILPSRSFEPRNLS